MKVSLEIDPSSGFCPGVVRAVRQAEDYLALHDTLHSLGPIVHNSLEIDRLKAKGLRIVDIDSMESIAGSVLLIRAHGEPPSTYEAAAAKEIELIDCTCPVVLRLQQEVRKAFLRMKSVDGTVVIFGKHGHAEVNGLVGQTEGSAVVIGSIDDVADVDFTRPIELFSQTTKDPVEYETIVEIMRSRGKDVKVHNTICAQVSTRHESLVNFARSHSMILFISGRESSNGKVLFNLCKSVNPRSWWIEEASQVDPAWIRDGDSIGICGATSTPAWQLEEAMANLSSILE
ncbi:MAG: 4-hydroxy-3-methylbut-2-enyl diphosphate reductase [Bacteroidales bacterium]|jgi:4-hydroxy-3-methylbut-2-enyl diphosphate reductase|nr:4-hydroxy-3-methylbut-2-enyl diphosphate reductase [Bacteroidales bacterium]